MQHRFYPASSLLPFFLCRRIKRLNAKLKRRQVETTVLVRKRKGLTVTLTRCVHSDMPKLTNVVLAMSASDDQPTSARAGARSATAPISCWIRLISCRWPPTGCAPALRALLCVSNLLSDLCVGVDGTGGRRTERGRAGPGEGSRCTCRLLGGCLGG